ncbi:hypothetical protein EMO92_08920 [Bifidobacterium reuteri]|uniref:Uncharacterized protein n=1 Tax=Bifidobacterium reuteri TaxID=983706 RepID=A0A5J5E4R8_9BIFI|nr:hypothetical protein [Bifidobacterium reuteri]KAA8824233.1 hypothetical protein EMO92_08920 [Bifidobacterium reuteri]
MSIDITQQALNALADAGLGNDSPAEAYVIGYAQGHDDALALAVRIERTISAQPASAEEIERLACILYSDWSGLAFDWEHADEDSRAYWRLVAEAAWNAITGAWRPEDE